MLSTISQTVETLRQVLPEGATLSLSIHPTSHSILLHNCAEWMFDQGAVAHEWYAFDEEAGTCQRNIFLKVEGGTLQAAQRNIEAGLTLAECRAQNALRETAAAA
jgi:hypothetical protein